MEDDGVKNKAEQQMLSQLSVSSIKEQAEIETRLERQNLREKENQRKKIASLLVKQQEEKFLSPSKSTSNSKPTGRERLDFLLKQTEFFTTFILQQRQTKSGVDEEKFNQVQKIAMNQMRNMAAGDQTHKRKNKKSTQNYGDGVDKIEDDDGNFAITRLDTQPSIL